MGLGTSLRQGSRLGSTKDDIMDGVVPQDTITVSPTANLMVSKNISKYVCACVCMYVHVYVYVYVCADICMCMYVYADMCMYVCSILHS